MQYPHTLSYMVNAFMFLLAVGGIIAIDSNEKAHAVSIFLAVGTGAPLLLLLLNKMWGW